MSQYQERLYKDRYILFSDFLPNGPLVTELLKE